MVSQNEPSTPSRSATAPTLKHTPFHQRLSSKVPQTSTTLFRDSAHVEAATEMKGKFWGPVPVHSFLDEFLNVKTSRMPAVRYTKFVDVASQGKEPDMYVPLISALKPFCKGITLIDTSDHEDPESGVLLNARVKPDIGIYANEDLPKDGECVTQAKLMLGFGELKNDSIHEPFALNQPGYSIGATHLFERDTVSAGDSRGQITLYANAIQATQFRTHSFSFFINKTNCRLIHWSRSCAIVTDEFNYTETNWLPKFFWRLSHAPKHLRGIDTTFIPVLDDTEAQKTRKALGIKPKDATPLYKVAVKDDLNHKTTFYIVSKPFTNNHIFPVGRGTRCFKAFDCQKGTIVLLKDTWRVSKYEPEGSIYRELHQAKVRNIAEFITAGDVGHVCGETEKFSTAVQDRRPRVHHHYRLVLGTVGTPLEHFSSTWQMVNASTDALIAHSDAVIKAKILHRDISSGNIVIVGEKGILIDWELCKRIEQSPQDARSYEKTGTFQFISARLLTNETLEHRVGDDLESFVHVLTWIAIKYAQNSLPARQRTRLLKKFDSSIDGVGGDDKAEFFRSDSAAITEIGIEQEPLSMVLEDIFSGFGHRYRSVAQSKLKKKDEKAAEAELEKLETHDWLLGVLEEALKDEEWRDARDGRVDQDILDDRPLTEAQRKRKSMLPEYNKEQGSNSKRSRRS